MLLLVTVLAFIIDLEGASDVFPPHFVPKFAVLVYRLHRVVDLDAKQ